MLSSYLQFSVRNVVMLVVILQFILLLYALQRQTCATDKLSQPPVQSQLDGTFRWVVKVCFLSCYHWSIVNKANHLTSILCDHINELLQIIFMFVCLERNERPKSTVASEQQEYERLANYRAHVKPNVIRVNKIDANVLSGTLFDNDNLADVEDASSLCSLLPQCVGYSVHPTAGVFLHNAEAFPLQYTRNWNFYWKKVANVSFPEDIPLVPRKFFTFQWNFGRTNNQLYSFRV
ncbi:hypothetical protein RFI_19654, partial [Reticulomyxa filosa]